jgi:uncharacterized RDD family membrane protein YckC
MAKHQRFRDTKKGKTTERQPKVSKVQKPKIPFARGGLRAKAFLTDIFMLFMPFIYFVIYIIMGGLEEASHEKLLTWGYSLLPFLVLITIFMFKDNGRTPGERSQSLKVIDFDTLDKPSLFSIIFRNLTLVLTLIIPFAWFVMIFRKDSRTLHDFLSNTCVIIDHSNTKKS